MLYPGIPVYRRPGCKAEERFRNVLVTCVLDELCVSLSLFSHD